MGGAGPALELDVPAPGASGGFMSGFPKSAIRRTCDSHSALSRNDLDSDPSEGVRLGADACCHACCHGSVAVREDLAWVCRVFVEGYPE